MPVQSTNNLGAILLLALLVIGVPLLLKTISKGNAAASGYTLAAPAQPKILLAPVTPPGTYHNAEHWTIERDREGRMSGFTINRDAHVT